MSAFTAQITGRLGRDPEMAYTQNGTGYTRFSLAVDMGWGDSKETQWFNVTVWGKQAESVYNHVAKGSLVAVTTTDLRVRTYDTKAGETRASCDVKASDVRFLSSKGDTAGGQQYAPGEDLPF